MTAEMDLGAPISSMELAHGGGTLSVTSGSKVHFLDILRYVYSFCLAIVGILVCEEGGIKNKEERRSETARA